MGDFKELEEKLRGWVTCPKQVRRALLPELAVEHSRKVVEADDRLRSWKPDPSSDWGLLYHCSEAAVDFGRPAGTAQLISITFARTALVLWAAGLCSKRGRPLSS